MRIYDLYGKVTMSIPITAPETNISQEKMKSGIYFYEIYNDGKSLGKGKLIAQ